ncbi:MAG: regulatory iron-sulfur-containing complex subunit RicT [Candidatus Zixiibacteriota bacterium]
MAELYLVEFKGSRKEYFYNSYHHALKAQEHVIVQADQGEDIGVLMKRIDAHIDFADAARPRSILRPAGREDRLHLDDLRKKEAQYKKEILVLIRKHGLVMKVVDCECQFDGNKITFFFTAEHRVDFRALVRDLASRYRTRIELRQIGVRDEARRLDGYGICGRRQCCNTFIRDFAPISTAHAREQDLSLNPSKISGNCGRLLCCLRYEVDMYSSAKRAFPAVGMMVVTKQGPGILQRVDIFQQEAILMAEDGSVFRAKAADILSAFKPQAGETAAVKPAPSAITEDETAAGTTQDELSKLDEPESLQP